MRKIIIIIIVCFKVSIIGNSQDVKSSPKSRKEIREAEMIMNFKALDAFLETKKFVIEMEYILDGNGNSKKLNQMFNYIMIDSSTCFWQSDATDIFTDLFGVVSKVEGSMDSWKLVKDIKHLNYFLQFRMFTDNGLYRVDLTVSQDKTVSGSINNVRNRLTFLGRIVTN